MPGIDSCYTGVDGGILSNRLKVRIMLGSAGLIVAGFFLCNYLHTSDIKETRTTAFEIRSAAIRWQIDHGDAACPIIKQLIEGKYLLPHTPGVDAWDQPYTITC